MKNQNRSTLQIAALAELYGRSTEGMSLSSDHEMTAVLEAIDHYSDGDVERPQEIMVELQEGCSNKHKRLNKKV